MKTISYISIILFLFGCGSAPIRTGYDSSGAYYDFSPRRDAFWNKASKTQDFNERIKLYNRYIEGKYAHLYDQLIWSTTLYKYAQDSEVVNYVLANPVLKNYFKSIFLKNIFEFYDQNANKLVTQNLNYIEEFKNLKKTFKSKYPDAHLSAIYVAFPYGPSNTLGLASLLKESQTIRYVSNSSFVDELVVNKSLIINSDTISLRPDLKEHVILHELAHLYHYEHLSLKNTYNPLVMSLYVEGVAEALAYTFPYKGIDRSFLAEEKGEVPEAITAFLEEVRAEMKIKNDLKLKNSSFLQQGSAGHSNCGEIDLKKNEKFNCLSVYSLGKGFAEQLIKKYGLKKSLSMNYSTVQKEMIRYFKSLPKSSDTKIILRNIK